MTFLYFVIYGLDQFGIWVGHIADMNYSTVVCNELRYVNFHTVWKIDEWLLSTVITAGWVTALCAAPSNIIGIIE